MIAHIRALSALAVTTVMEAIRDRILYGLLAFAIGLILLSAVLSNLTIGHQVRLVTNLSLSGITVAASIMATLLGVSAVGREIDRRTLYPVLAKPVGRATYLVGKYLGVVATVGLNVLLMSIAATVMIAQYQYVQPFQYPIADYLAHIGLLTLRMAVIAAIAIALSTIASATVALIATLGITIAAYFTTDLKFFLGQSEDAFVRTLGEWLYWIVPDFSVLDSLPRLVHGHPILTDGALISALYALLYAISVLGLGWWAFSRRDLA